MTMMSLKDDDVDRVLVNSFSLILRMSIHIKIQSNSSESSMELRGTLQMIVELMTCVMFVIFYTIDSLHNCTNWLILTLGSKEFNSCLFCMTLHS